MEIVDVLAQLNGQESKKFSRFIYGNTSILVRRTWLVEAF
jgi:hypothetical protein